MFGRTHQKYDKTKINYIYDAFEFKKISNHVMSLLSFVTVEPIPSLIIQNSASKAFGVILIPLPYLKS